LSSAFIRRGRPPKYQWDLLLDVREGAPCGLAKPCEGTHAYVWHLKPGEDYPATLKAQNLRVSMHAKAKSLGLKCHTTKQKDGIQVQFYAPKEQDG
jgi:hypothetical protein